MGRNVVLVARGFFLATGVYCSLYAWWVYQNEPTGVASLMYWWIRHFYGSLAMAVAGWIAFLLTLSSARADKGAPDADGAG